MKHDSNSSDWDRIYPLMEGVHESAADLIRWSNDHSDEVSASGRGPLIHWLLESSENQALFDQVRQTDQSIKQALLQTPQPDSGFVGQLKSVLDSGAPPARAAAEKDVPPNYQEWFDHCSIDQVPDEDEQQGNVTRSPDHSYGQPVSEPGSQPRLNPSAGGRSRRWWMGIGATIATVAASISIAVLLNPQLPEVKPAYTAAMLCQDSLSWNPNSEGDAEWNLDLSLAPHGRDFPGHLIRLQARSWKKIEIAGDEQAVVYNLIPQGNLSELKAYVYVFRSSHEFDLPSQFASHPTANRKYRFWSLACQQDLVFVLVFEGDEKRLADLIEVQQVG